MGGEQRDKCEQQSNNLMCEGYNGLESWCVQERRHPGKVMPRIQHVINMGKSALSSGIYVFDKTALLK